MGEAAAQEREEVRSKTLSPRRINLRTCCGEGSASAPGLTGSGWVNLTPRACILGVSEIRVRTQPPARIRDLGSPWKAPYMQAKVPTRANFGVSGASLGTRGLRIHRPVVMDQGGHAPRSGSCLSPSISFQKPPALGGFLGSEADQIEARFQKGQDGQVVARAPVARPDGRGGRASHRPRAAVGWTHGDVTGQRRQLSRLHAVVCLPTIFRLLAGPTAGGSRS